MSKEVFVFGGKAEANDLAARRARFTGSFWQVPNLVNSYAHAARSLLAVAVAQNQLKDLALPIFFAQRHSVELMLKHVIEVLVEQRRDDQMLSASDAEFLQLIAEDREDERGLRTHMLDQLIDFAKRLLAEQIPQLPLPSEFSAVAALIDSFEDGHVERARYLRVTDKRSRREITAAKAAGLPMPDLRSLPSGKEVVLPLGDIQDAIEALLEGPMKCDSDADDTFLSDLACISQSNDEHLYKMGRL